jgi:putative transposase
MTLRAYKYRIYPTKQQTDYLNRVFGSVRFVWNQLVANFNSWTPDGPNRPMNEKILKDTPEYGWLSESISYALQQKRIDFDETKSQFFSKNRKKKLGRMKFKKKGIARDSFRIPVASMGGQKAIDLGNNMIKLPKMTAMKIVVDRKFTGTAKSVTVSKNKIGQFFVSILVEEDVKVKTGVGRSIGIDLGLNHLVTLSSGVQVENPRWFRETKRN